MAVGILSSRMIPWKMKLPSKVMAAIWNARDIPVKGSARKPTHAAMNNKRII